MVNVFKDKIFLKQFFDITLPVMVQTVFSFMVTFIDNIMVGGLSNEAVSATYTTNNISFLYFVGSYGLLTGASIFVQQFFGAKDHEHLTQAIRYKVYIGSALLIIFFPLASFFGMDIIRLYVANDSAKALILSVAKDYLPWIVLSYIPFMYSFIFLSTYRETARTLPPMIATVSALLTNISFNVLFIYGLKWGLAGVGFATFLARSVEFLVIFGYSYATKDRYFMSLFRRWTIEPKLILRITQKMLPALTNEVLWSLGVNLLSLAYAQRPNVLSALSILSTNNEIYGFIYAGFSTGVAVIIGTTLGAGKIEEAKLKFNQLAFLGIFMSLGLSTIVLFLSPYIPQLWFEVSDEQQALATSLIMIYASLVWVFSISVSGYQTLRAGGQTPQTIILDAGFMWLVILPVGWFIALYTPLPMWMLYLAVQSLEILKMMLALWLIRRYDWAKDLTKSFRLN